MKKSKKKLKLLVVYSQKNSDWESCKVISHGLKSAYERLAKVFEVHWLPLSTVFSETYHGSYKKVSEVYDLKEKLQKTKPDRLVFIDHLPHPLQLIEAFLKSDSDLELPPIDFHVYGDFTYYAAQWVALGKLLKRHPIRFICASKKQSSLITELINSGLKESSLAHMVEPLFFPVDSGKYFFDPTAKAKARKKWGIPIEDKVILYTGRLSLQKNILRLIREFVTLSENTKQVTHLVFAGTFDDIGAGIFGISTPVGYYFSRVTEALKKIPEQIRNRIHFLGQIGSDELREAYCGADVFSSLSLYHDEDYGMSVAEAMSCGLPCLISDWGGFSSFVKGEYNSFSVPVAIHKNGILISSSHYQQSIQELLTRPLSPNERADVGKKFSADFSIDAAADRLKEILRQNVKPFTGFNWKLDYLASLVHANKPKEAFIPKKGSFYEDIYRPYFSENLEENMKWNLKEDLSVWLYDYLDVSQRKPYIEPKNDARNLLKNFWPFCEPYFSAVNPIFVMEGWERHLIEAGARWQSRDGILPLFWFFRTVKPSDFPAKLWIHRDMESLIPDSWQKEVGLYEIENKKNGPSQKEADTILLAGLICPPFINEPELEARLEQLIERVGSERIKKMKIEIFMPFRGSGIFWSHFDEEVYLSLPLKIAKILGGDVQPVGWQRLETMKSMSNTIYFELNAGWIVKDSSILHMALSRGAQLLTPLTPILPDSEVIELSRYHQIRIAKPGKPKKALKTEPLEDAIRDYTKIGEFLYDKRFNPVFPEWYQSFCRKTLKEFSEKSL